MMKHTKNKTKYPSHYRKSESGNVLWFILIALVLIGLLTALLSRSGTSVDQTGDVEQQRIKINQMMRYLKGLESTIQQMKLRGISENEISFYRDLNNDGNDNTSPDAGEFYNSNCTSNDCLVFHVDGGGLTAQDPPVGINDGSDWIYTARLRVDNIGTTVGGSAASSELLVMLQNVTPQMCVQINRLLDVDNPSGSPPKDSANSNPVPLYDGTYLAGNLISGSVLSGNNAACYDGDDGSTNPPEGTYQFYYVLMAR